MSAQVVVGFDRQTQSLDALHAAAYRMIGRAHCKIEATDSSYVCRLTLPTSLLSAAGDLTAIESIFRDYVSDENLREIIRMRTEPTRNLLLSLAFGALAAQSDQN